MNEEEFKDEYIKHLADLSFNSKPIINNLTILAEENVYAARTITELITRRILEVSPAGKLPYIYLIDSILKNIGAPYVDLFARDIDRIFVDSWMVVDIVAQYNMLRVLDTWPAIFKEHGSVLGRIERMCRVRIGEPRFKPNVQTHKHQTSQMYPPTIPPNPEFIRHRTSERYMYEQDERYGGRGHYNGYPPGPPLDRYFHREGNGGRYPIPPPPNGYDQRYNRNSDYHDAPRHLNKRDRPYWAEARPGEKRMMHDENERKRRRHSAVHDSGSSFNTLSERDIQHLGSVQNFVLNQIGEEPTDSRSPVMSSLYTALRSPISGKNVGVLSKLDNTLRDAGVHLQLEPDGVPPPVPPLRPTKLLDMNTIAQNLLQGGILQISDVDVVGNKGIVEVNKGIGSGVKEVDRKCLNLLYDGSVGQCHQCGLRFKYPEEEKTHLDWHFQMNKEKRERQNTAISRRWFMSEDDWVTSNYKGNVYQPSSHRFFDAVKEPDTSKQTESTDKTTSIIDHTFMLVAEVEDLDSICGICGEALEQVWHGEQDAWVFPGVVLEDDGKGEDGSDRRLCHTRCQKST